MRVCETIVSGKRGYFRLLTPALSSFGEERENYFAGRFTQGDTAFALGYYLSLRWSFDLMNTKDFLRLGVPLGPATRRATDFISRFILGGGDKTQLEQEVKAIVTDPSAFVDDPLREEFTRALLSAPPRMRMFSPQQPSSGLRPPSPAPTSEGARAEPVKYRQWGEGLDHEAVMQMEKACLLPVSVAGALMPDAHVGYGLPIGGVLATENAVIPYAVGVDIACRMKMTVLDIPLRDLERKQDRLTRAIEAETRFGVGASFKNRREHEVMDADWSVSSITKQNKDRAWSQLGTSGSGNHFVEFGLFTLHSDLTHPLIPSFSPSGGEGVRRTVEGATQHLPAGTYVALLSHSGSHGTGAAVCDHYSKIAFSQFSDLPKELKRLAWLSLDSGEGQEYWNAMELMGRYAAANHACIHRHIAENLGAQVLLDLENHHNFAWKERYVIDGVEREVIVHRKGATPAGRDVLGIIPGSMASPGFVVSGKGNSDSLNSASHGAGRAMSRKAANEKFNWKDVNRFLRERGVTLISVGLDEVPMAYKNIREVMAAQNDLVTVLGEFMPRLVKMAPGGERPED
ncbi:MAG TPA: RtcB family protein [Candidatus Angelobacter sp.]|nr:RtcB family protein [Candidatus Angelobacter sp.]